MLVVALGLLTGCALFKSSKSSASHSASSAADDPDAAQNNLIRNGDTLNIQLSGVPIDDQATFTLKVDDNGNISMPYIGNVRASGITSAELKSGIETLYKTNRVYTNPNVTIVPWQERYVSISGEVKNPQQITYYRGITALAALAQAGGFTDYANRSKCKLLRGSKVIEFSAKEIQNDPRKDLSLLPNDRILIERAIFDFN
jgi:polysaccharide export outer membrane protein